MWATLCDLQVHNPYSVALAGVPAIVNLWILGYSLGRLPRDRLTAVFCSFVGWLVVWQVYDVMVRLSGSPETSAAWRALLRLGQQLAVPAGLHFALLFAGRERWTESPLYLVATYGLALFFNSAYAAGVIHENLVYSETWGWMAHENLGPVYTVEVSINSTMALAMTAALWALALSPSTTGNRRRAAQLLAVGISLPVAGGIVFEAVLPEVLGVRQVPITSTLMSGFSIAAIVALTRYDLFRISTLSAARAVLETVTDALLVTTATGVVLYANPEAERRFGAGKVLIGANVRALFTDPRGGAAFEAGPWARVTRGDRLAGVELRLRDASDRDQPTLASMAPISVSRTGPPGVVLVLHDVTALVDAQRALEIARDQAEESSRSKTLFLATMSHELRTPLNAVIGYSELLAEQTVENAVLEDLDRIRQAGRHLLDLIDDILDLSKAESGQIELDLVDFSVDDLLLQLGPIGTHLCERNGNRFAVRVHEPLTLRADVDRTRQVLLNLIGNAAKFTNRGEIEVGVAREGGWVRLEISDTGIGMSAEQQSRLFGLFTQVNENREKYGGTGLGLALSRRLCQMMGGDIAVRSEVGRGSTFTVRLPGGSRIARTPETGSQATRPA